MATAQQIIERAARLAGVQAEGQTLNSSKLSTYLALLNEMLDSWRNENIDFGLSALLSTSTVYIDNNYLLAIRYNLAQAITDDAGKPPRATILNEADGLKRMLVAKFNPPEETYIDPFFSHMNEHYTDI